jgi:starch phosphorylase
LANWRRQIEQEWPAISFDYLQTETRDGQHHFRVEVILGKVDPEAVQVELFAEEPEGRAWRQPMARGDKLLDREGGYVFTAQVPATRPPGDFTPPPYPLLCWCRRAAGDTLNFMAPLIATGRS